VDTAGAVPAGAGGAAGAVSRAGAAGLVAGARRRLAGRGEKGGAQVARSLRGSPGSRYHLAVDANGAPLAVRLGAGNENERRHLLPLLDELLAREIRPLELWADRGYHGAELAQQIEDRDVRPRISRPRRAGDPIADEEIVAVVWRGRQRRVKSRDPLGRHRWQIERTNAWLKARRRIATRRDRKPDNYLAFLQLGMILILTRSF
jgi:transposase